MNSAAGTSEKKIAVKARGNSLGIWFFEVMIRFFGLKGAYLLLEFVALHYTLFDRAAVSASLSYLTRRFPGDGRLKRYFRVHRLFVSQGRQLIDRYAIARRPDYFRYTEQFTPEVLYMLKEAPGGVVILMSHVGNWQVALRQMGHLKKDICVVMRPEDNPAVRDSLRLGRESRPVQLINPEGYLGGVLEMIQALEEGKIVCIMGDRGYGFETVEVSFLGSRARFPFGAFSVAAAAKSPVLALFSHKISERDYVVNMRRMWRPAYDKDRAKKDQIREWVQSYAEELENFVQRHPYECFLFHDVWQHKKEQ